MQSNDFTEEEEIFLITSWRSCRKLILRNRWFYHPYVIINTGAAISCPHWITSPKQFVREWFKVNRQRKRIQRLSGEMTDNFCHHFSFNIHVAWKFNRENALTKNAYEKRHRAITFIQYLYFWNHPAFMKNMFCIHSLHYLHCRRPHTSMRL